MKRTPLKRKTAIKQKRETPRRGEPSPAEIAEYRRIIYAKSGGRCELNVLTTCRQGVLPFDDPSGNIWKHWHLVHVRARRRFGWPTEGPDRMRGGCPECHLRGLHSIGLKPKPLPEEAY
jgi:hypothetical protein